MTPSAKTKASSSWRNLRPADVAILWLDPVNSSSHTASAHSACTSAATFAAVIVSAAKVAAVIAPVAKCSVAIALSAILAAVIASAANVTPAVTLPTLPDRLPVMLPPAYAPAVPTMSVFGCVVATKLHFVKSPSLSTPSVFPAVIFGRYNSI